MQVPVTILVAGNVLVSGTVDLTVLLALLAATVPPAPTNVVAV
jgi:hypothetical protein